MDPTICKAIREKKVIRFYYDGGYRLAEPHCYGVSRVGNELLRAYQISSHSESGEPVEWKLFRVDRISDLSVAEQGFEAPRPGYNPADKAMASIYCCL